MSEESDRDALLRLTRESSQTDGAIGGFLLGVFLTVLIGGIVVMMTWPHR